jgi:hypothetical protein
VDPLAESCLYESVPEGAEVEAKVLTYRGGKLDVRLRVEGPEGKPLYNALLFSNLNDKGQLLDVIVKKGTTFKAHASGVYAFCIDNRMAKYTAKHVVVNLDVRDPGSPAAKAARAAEAALAAGMRTGQETAVQSIDFMRAAGARLMAKLHQIEEGQLYHYHRERRHRTTIESTNDRISKWSGAESAAILLAAGLQLFLVRRWFGKGGAGGKGGFEV